MQRHYADQISEADQIDARDADLEPREELTHYVSLSDIERTIFRGKIALRLRPVCGGDPIFTADSRLTATCPKCQAWLEADAEDDDATNLALGFVKVNGCWVPQGRP